MRDRALSRPVAVLGGGRDRAAEKALTLFLALF